MDKLQSLQSYRKCSSILVTFNSRFDNHNLVPLTRKSVVEFDAQQQNEEDKVGQHIGFYDHNKSKPKTSLDRHKSIFK